MLTFLTGVRRNLREGSVTGPDDLLEQAWEIFRREAFVISGGSAAERKAAAEKMRALVAQARDRYREDGDAQGESKALRRLGGMELFAGEPQRSRKAFDGALEISREIDDLLGAAKAQRGLGRAEAAAKRWDKAREDLQDAAAAFLVLGERKEAAEAQSDLARVLEKTGAVEAAIRTYGEAHENSTAEGDMHGAGHALQSQANLYKDIGASERWLEGMERAATCFRRIEETDKAIMSLMLVATSFMVAGAHDRHERLEREIAELREKAGREAEQSDDPETRIRALLDRARAAGRDRKGRSEARKAYEEALRIDAAAGGTDLRGHILSAAAMHEAHADNLERARGFYREAIELFEEKGELWKAGDDLVIWGQRESHAGNYDAALSIFDRALGFKRKVGEPRSEAFTLGQIAWVHQQRKRYDESRAAFREALELYRKAGDRNGECLELRGLANLEAEAGDREGARRLYAEARRIHQEDGEWHGEGYTLRDWGDMERKAGNLEAAHDLFEEARDLFGGHGELRGEGEMLGRLGRMNLNRNPRSAARYYLEAAKRFKKLGFTDAFERAMKRHRQAGGREELD